MDFIARVVGGNRMDERTLRAHEKIQQMLKDKRFQLRYSRKGKPGDELISVSKRTEVFGKTPREEKFTFKSKRTGEKIDGDLADYFLHQYNCTLKFPDVPTICMFMGVKKDRTGKPILDDSGKPIKDYNYIPPELLTIVPGQKAVGVSEPDRMVKVRRAAASLPAVASRFTLLTMDAPH